MTDIIFNSHTYENLLADAERLGFTQTDAEGNVTIITNGSLGGTGGWFLNLVATVYEPVTPPANPEDPWPAPVPREGFWGRLRLNGDTSGVPPFDPSITQYVYNAELGGWTDDGVTVAPDWIGTIGMIA
jgi:hypothetical protein